MNYSVIPSERFKREAKKLIKKYASLKKELFELNVLLEQNPESGVSLGNNCYKIRIKIKSKGKGKSGGGRVITYCVNENSEVYLLTIYDKSEFENIDVKMLAKIIETLY
jgi:mRNA-degrading endonuclease RelE of RelBE toxin-antitoxin system